MNSRAFTLSLVIAGIAMFMVYSFLEGREAQFVEEYGNPSPLVVAKVDIKELELIDDRKLKIENIPKKFQMPGHFKKIEELYNTIAATPIKAGEQITRPRITYPGAQSGLSRQIAVGKRALSVRVEETTAVSKLIKPGDRVDVLATIDYAGGKKERIKVKTVLQDVLVLSTGLYVTNSIPIVNLQTSETESREMKLNKYVNFNSVTLELDPYEVQKMIFIISSGGGIHLTLRNNDDKTMERITGTRLYDVLGEDAAEAKAYFADQLAKDRARSGGQGGR
jgi:pilus assembly protein CpaB